MRFGLWMLLWIVFLPAWSQIDYLPIEKSRQLNGRLDSIKIDTITLPFWDDFSASVQLNQSLWQWGNDVWINNTQSIQAPTQNVASFDGLNQLGLPHSIISEFNGPGDSLVSLPIDLSQLTPEESNTLYFSFYWQLKGNGDLPSPEDSLRLQFFNRDSSWITQDINPAEEVKSLIGGITNLIFDDDSIQTFTQVILPLNAQFLHAGFKFRFQAFTSLNGMYDTWHIDYIYLNSGRRQSDIYHFDRAISSLQQSLFYPYVSLPVEQLLSDIEQYQTQEIYSFSNLDNTFHPARYSYQMVELFSGNKTNRIFDTPPDMLPNETGRTIIVPKTLLPALTSDPAIIQTELIYLTGDKKLFENVTPEGDTLFLTPDLSINDTLRNYYILYNYLAYDDGTAEIAAGINLNQGQIAVKFFVNTPDTLTDIAIYFPPIFPSTVGESITLRVWNELDNLALARTVGGVIEATGANEFQQFTLGTPLIVRDTFYIGFQQFTDNYIGIGLDKNNFGGSSNIYSNTNREWVQNDRISGSLMIRPIFKNAKDYILSNPSIAENQPITFYPNPTSFKVNFSQIVDQVSIVTLSGQVLISQQHVSALDLSDLSAGIYVIHIQKGEERKTEQLIIR